MPFVAATAKVANVLLDGSHEQKLTFSAYMFEYTQRHFTNPLAIDVQGAAKNLWLGEEHER
jgi:hypothetical protein